MNKKILILPFLLIISMFSAYAFTCTIITPSANGVLNVGNIINVSTTNIGVTETSTTLYINASSPSTRNSSSSTLWFNQANTTLGAVNSTNLSVSTTSQTSIDESNDYTLYASISNSTDRVSCGTVTGITVDRTATTAPTSITFTNPLKAGDTITATISRDNANRCFMRFGSPSAPRNTMTLSGSTCTYTVQSDTPPNSDYQAFVEADDRTNSTLSAAQNIIVRATLSDGGGFFQGATLRTTPTSGGQSVLGGSSNPFIPGQNKKQLLLVIVIAGGAFLLFKKKN